MLRARERRTRPPSRSLLAPRHPGASATIFGRFLHSRALTWRFALVVGLGVGAVSCGPIVYVNEVTRGASTAIESAREAHADKYSPYWWTRATEYYRKARELAAAADFQAANHYGRVATEAAQRAAAEAEIAAKDPSKRPFEPQQLAPAKETP
jgi:hypothetical protein